MADVKHPPDQYKGWLHKWTNYLRGYQKRWFVLQNGLLSYYRTQAEMAHTCRGTISLANAFIHTEDSCTFVISNGGTHSFHLKASSEIERQKWVTALELAKSTAIHSADSDSDDENQQLDKNELQNTLRILNVKLQDLNTCNDLIAKHGTALQRALCEIEQYDSASDIAGKIKSVNERATLFRITSTAMMKACSDYLDMAQNQGKRWQKMLQHEHEQRLQLEDMVEQLAKQQMSLENQARKSLHAVAVANSKSSNKAERLSGQISPTLSDDEDFFDAIDHQVEEYMVVLPHGSKHKRHASDVSVDSFEVDEGQTSSESDLENNHVETATVFSPKEHSSNVKSRRDLLREGRNEYKSFGSQDKRLQTRGSDHSLVSRSSSYRKHRTTIPERPNYSINMWSIMKNCIGRELSKIPMPVNFNEPLSMLQRLTEDFEYSDILDNAARCEDASEQMAWVAAFTISSYAPTTVRTGKPFNPLLGETFEVDRREEYGWRAIAEQVSHHPPTAAQYTEGLGWTLWQEFTMCSKFRGKYLQIIPMGIAHLVFQKSGNHYTWRKVTTTVHNIIVGKLWVDNHGEMDITNHQNNNVCHLKFSAYSYFSREIPRKVTGVVTTSSGRATWVLTGTWDAKMEAAPVIHVVESNKGKPVFETGPYTLLWKRRMPPPGSEKIYHFTQLAVELNEPEVGVAPTDSRNRPDQRFMENGQWDEANRCKQQLEEKQRAARRHRDAEIEAAAAQGVQMIYQPKWFKKEIDPQTNCPIHVYNKKYWECKEKKTWESCPDIYL